MNPGTGSSEPSDPKPHLTCGVVSSRGVGVTWAMSTRVSGWRRVVGRRCSAERAFELASACGGLGEAAHASLWSWYPAQASWPRLGADPRSASRTLAVLVRPPLSRVRSASTASLLVGLPAFALKAAREVPAGSVRPARWPGGRDIATGGTVGWPFRHADSGMAVVRVVQPRLWRVDPMVRHAR